MFRVFVITKTIFSIIIYKTQAKSLYMTCLYIRTSRYLQWV